jgi:CRISPR/Cas system-associated exonuclease Cas4 (RecB family)
VRALRNQFSWSHSRNALLDICPRAYYLQYYASWGGWNRRAPQAARDAYALKKLENRWGWSGKLVHHFAAEALLSARAGKPRSANELVDRVREAARAEWSESLRGSRRSKNTRGFFGLLEHEYAEPIGADEWVRVWERTDAALRSFVAGPEGLSGWPDFVASLGADQLLALDVGGFDESATFRWLEVDAWAKPDLAYKDGEATAVVDWKTGHRSEDHVRQVVGYALYLSEKFGVRLDKVDLIVHYLSDGLLVVNLTEQMVRDFTDWMRSSIERMRALVVDRDLEKNEARPEGAFEMTDNLGKCHACQFRRLCGREK